MDFILNGQASGSVAAMLMQYGFDVGCLRPMIGNDGNSYMFVNDGQGNDRKMLCNAPATLRRDEWIQIDEAVIRVAQPRLTAVADLRSRNLVYTIPNGMGKTVLEYQTIGDITPAEISMDGLRRSQADRPTFDLGGLPLPIIHKDFHYSARQIAVSRNGGSPLDTTTAELASRKVAEEAEKLLCGTSQDFSYATYPIYGYTNTPVALTKVMTAPTGANNAVVIAEIVAMRQQSIDNNYFGPWMIYVSSNWDSWLDLDYSTAKGDNTLRQRIMDLEGIEGIKTLYHLPPKKMILVQMTSDVVREVVGMDITTVQWETHGGMMLNFKVLAILVPQIRADINEQTGIVVGTHP